jgi:hypothetical protein
MNYDSFGNIRIRAYTASGALPTEGALVKIYGADEGNNGVIFSLLTDNDGVTREIPLPAPPKAYSTSPGAFATPYSVYNVEIAKDGFYPKRIDNVPIFNGISAVLPIEMIPLSYDENGALIPQSNLNSIVYENENLE